MGEEHKTNGLACGIGLGAAALMCRLFEKSQPPCNYKDAKSGLFGSLLGVKEMRECCLGAETPRYLGLPPLSKDETASYGHVDLDRMIHELAKRIQDMEWMPTNNDRISCHDAENGLFIIRHMSFQGLESYYLIQAKSSQEAVNEVLRKM